jgi:hypothetical protein
VTRLSSTICLFAGLIWAAGAVPIFSQHTQVRRNLDALVAAYPDALVGHDDKLLRWRDGTVSPVSGDNANDTFDELLHHASVIDQFRIPYPRARLETAPAVDADPGRLRNAAFFTKMYGECKNSDVKSRLVNLAWLPNSWGQEIQITSTNDVNKHLSAVSAELDALPDRIKQAANPIAGTYNCRVIADTGGPSPHSYGIAIDLNLAFSDYWFWHRHTGKIAYRNRMPQEIVQIFENHGFIWGGKWYHYDTMHFEYRPELLAVGN